MTSLLADALLCSKVMGLFLFSWLESETFRKLEYVFAYASSTDSSYQYFRNDKIVLSISNKYDDSFINNA